MKPKNILFPTDFSPCSEHAFEHALLFARQTEAKLHIFHLTVLLVDDPTNPAFHCRDAARYERQAQLSTVNAIRELVRRHDADDVEIVMTRRRGISAGAAILDYIEEAKIDLVVMGTHGHRGLAKAMLGSQAAKVVQLAGCPVITLCEKGSDAASPQIKKIVVPIDFSVPSERSLHLAGNLAKRFGAQVDLLHVIEYYLLPGVYGPGPGDFADLQHQVTDELEVMASTLRAEYGDQITTTTHVVEGRRASHGICSFAKAQKADLVVIASEGLTGLPRVFIGGTTQRTVAACSCPVLTVKAWAMSTLVDTDKPPVDQLWL